MIGYSVAAAFGFISSYLTYHYVKRQEIIDTVISDIEKKNIFVTIESENAKKERIRKEVIRWANPILGAGQDLEARLKNILEYKGYLALTKDYQEGDITNWSISYDYFLESSLYLFSQYFCWTRMLQEDLNFELFQTQYEKRDFFEAVESVSRALGSFPPNYGLGDRQVFKLQQRAIGEEMIVQNGNDRRCISYPDFVRKLEEDQRFRKHVEPLRSLLEDLNPNTIGRWGRLKNTQKQLDNLNKACNDLLSNK